MNIEKTELEKASLSDKRTEKTERTAHLCGAINGVMGKGAFSKEDDRFRCIECGKLLDKLPDGYMAVLRKMSPSRAKLLEKNTTKGAKTVGDEHLKWSEAGRKAWATRRANQAAKTTKN